jgi:hypothetical protein
LTAAQQLAARMLIPGAYEHSALRRATPDAYLGPATTPYVVAAPERPSTRFGQAAAILGDLALITAIMFVVVAAPTLVVWGIRAAGALVFDLWGRQ